jgi:hypothetical protein
VTRPEGVQEAGHKEFDMKLQAVFRMGLFALMLIGAFVAGQQFSRPVAAQSHQKWEYQIVGSVHTLAQINKLGEDGWEAVTLNASNRVLLRRSK